MNADLESEFSEAIECHLKNITAKLVEALRAMLASQTNADIAALRFEYESPHFDDSFPVVYWYVSQSGVSLAIRELLPELKSTIPETIISDPRYAEEGLNTWAIASEIFVRWFADCWEQAGGHQFCHPAYLAHHDSRYAFDLTRRAKVKQS